MAKPKNNTLICVICGAEYTRRAGKNITCGSLDCRAELSRRWRQKKAAGEAKVHIGEPVKCAVCGAVFPRKCAGAKYCSPACSRKAANAQKRERPGMSGQPDAVCEFCGQGYKRGSAKQKYCTPLCKGRAARALRESREKNPQYAEKRTVPMTFKECVVCGARFIPLSNAQKTCSDECRKKNERKTAHEYKQAMEERKRAEEAARKRVPSGMAEILAEAARMGLSYGKYIALMERGAVI